MGFVVLGRPRLPSLGAALAAWFVFFAPAKSHAQTYIWNQTGSQTWQTVTNWNLGSGHPNGPSIVAVFGNSATGTSTVSLSAGVTLGELRFEDVNAGTINASYSIGSGQTITFHNGSGPSLINVTGFTRTTQTIAANIVIGNSQPLNITNNGAPGLTTLTISGGISSTPTGSALVVGGSSNTTISGAIASSVGVVIKNGSGTLTLSGTNAHTGGTVVNGGALRVSSDSALGSGAVTLDGGAFQFGASFASTKNFTLGGSGGTILTSFGDGLLSNPGINGVISGGAGTGSLTFDGGGYATLLGSNTYTGPTIINNAGVILASEFFGAARGRLLNTSAITINGYVGGQIGILDFQNILGVDTTGDRVNSFAPITLNGGLIAYGAGLSGAANESLGALTVRGFGSFFGNQFGSSTGTGTGSVIFASIGRTDNFSTFYVGGPVSGPSIAGTSIQVLFTAGGPTLSGSGTGNQIGIIPWIGGDIGSSGAPTAHASTLYSYNTNGLFALDPTLGTNFQQIGIGSQLNGAVITIARNNAITGDPLALPASTTVTVLSLVQNPTSTAASTINGPSSSTLTVSTGAIANVNQLTFNGPTLNFGTNTGYLWLGNAMVIQGNSRITGSNGLVVSSGSEDGRNELYLLNAANPNTFSGGLYLNGTARVGFDTADSQLGDPGQPISFRGGSLWYIGGGSVSLTTGGVDRPLQMTAAGGGMIRVESGTLTVPGIVSGSEQLTVTGSGTLVLGNSTNSYSGGTTLGDSTLGIAGPGSLGSGNLTLGVVIGSNSFSGGTLRFDSSGTYAFNVNHAVGAAAVDTNGNNVTLSGVISGNGVSLTKSGAGTLTLSSANTYTASTTVSAGTLLVTNTTGSGTGYGSVTVNSGAAIGGTGIVGGPVTVNNGGGKLIVGQPGGTGTLTLRGATSLTSGSIFQTHLAGTVPGSGYAQLVITSGGSIALGGSTLTATLGYTPNPADKIFLIDNRNAANGLTGTFNGQAQGSTYTFADGTTALISYTGDFGTGSLTGGNDVVLYSFVPVPEPTTVLGIAGLALGGLMWRGRRRVETQAAELA